MLVRSLLCCCCRAADAEVVAAVQVRGGREGGRLSFAFIIFHAHAQGAAAGAHQPGWAPCECAHQPRTQGDRAGYGRDWPSAPDGGAEGSSRSREWPLSNIASWNLILERRRFFNTSDLLKR